jgi:hypothetical protein
VTPNSRLQRTRSSPSAHRSPLTRYPLGRRRFPVREAVFVCCRMLCVLSAAMAASPSPPTIDGVIGPKEWSGARRENLIGGGEALLIREAADLYVAVIGARPGYPTSLCVGDVQRVAVLHASAALGSVSYSRAGAKWLRGEPFEWRVRDVPGPAAALLAERESFLAKYGWLSTASRAGTPTREFRIKLGPERQFLGIVFLSTDTMEAAYWPASMSDGCRNLELLRGDAPDTLQLDPSQWHRLE